MIGDDGTDLWLQVQRGVHPREAKRLYHDLLRDETASTQAFALAALISGCRQSRLCPCNTPWTVELDLTG